MKSTNSKHPINNKWKAARISLKIRLLLIVISIVFLDMLGEGFLLVHNWKEDIRSEVDSSFNLAKKLVGNGMFESNGWLSYEVNESVIDALNGLRHLRVIANYNDKTVSGSEDKLELFKGAGVPEWFVNFIYPYENEPPKIFISDSEHFSKIIIEADPSDEIIDVWEDFRTRSISMIIFLCLIIFFIYMGLQIGLRPLNKLLEGFEKLETGSFDVKLSENVALELSRINEKFNQMVNVLHRTSSDNSLLARKMVNLQEEERRSLTRELHDEMAPHLFGIRVTTSKAGALLKNNNLNEISTELSAIDNIVENLQKQMRRLLSRLRPLILDDLNIKEALIALTETREVEEFNIEWNIELGELEDISDDTIKVTLYRIIQECVTNIIRHANASSVKIVISIKQLNDFATQETRENGMSQKILYILVEDDGEGILDETSHGFGLIGMRERVQALGGKFNLSSSYAGGVKIMINIPLHK